MIDNTSWVQRRMRKEMLIVEKAVSRLIWVEIVTLLLCLAAPCWSFAGLRRIPVEQPRGVARTVETVKWGDMSLSPCPKVPQSPCPPVPKSPSPYLEVPLFYELYWIGLISMVILLIFYFFYLYKKEKFRFVKPLTFLLLFLALSLYLMEQGQTFTGHFDPVRHLFVSGYHEATEIGFLRFIYKLTLGIALCVYGFTSFLARQKVEKAVSRLNKGTSISQNKKSMNKEAEPK
jgi:hypothetical protein